MMWSSIANLKENLNKIALDVHHDDDEEEFAIYGSKGGDGDVSVSDRRNSHSFAHSNSVTRSPIANGIEDVRHSEIEQYKAEIKRLQESERDIKSLSMNYAALLKEKEVMFGRPSSSVRHDALKFVYNSRMKEGTSVREHVLSMMFHFNVAEVNGAVIDEQSQVCFIMESLPKSFLQFRINAMMNKIEYNLTTLLNELHTYQSLMKTKGQEGEASIATSKKFCRGSSSRTKSGPSISKSKGIQKKMKDKGKGKAPTTRKGKGKAADKGKCFHCNENGHWKRNCPKYLAEKKAEKEKQEN